MSPRYSQRRADHIEYAFWLVFDNDGGVRLVRGQPSLDRNERAMSCLAKLPLALWRTPALSAVITVGAEGAADMRVSVEAAADQLRAVLGVDVDLRVTGDAAKP